MKSALRVVGVIVGDNIKISEIKLYDLETDKSIAAQEEEIARQEEDERKRDKECVAHCGATV